jgi:hypothetical protein
MTNARQLAAASLDVTRTHVVEHQGSIAQMPARQCVLDRRLRHAQPVERGVDFLNVDLAQSERHAEGIDGCPFVKRTGRGQLCGGIDQPLHDQRQSKIALTLWSVRQKLIEPDLTRHAQRRRDMSVRQRAQDLHAFSGRNQLVAAQRRP